MKKIVYLLLLVLTFSCLPISGKNKIVNIEDKITYNEIIKNSKNAVIIYGSTWCPHCLVEYENLSKLKNELDIDVKVIIFPFFKGRDYTSESIDFIKNKKYDFKFYLDTNKKILQEFNISSIPKIAIIKDGNEINSLSDETLNIEEIKEILKK